VADRCLLVTPPLLVDDVFRQSSASAEQHIGTARQTPFQLDQAQQAALLARVQKERPQVYASGPCRRPASDVAQAEGGQHAEQPGQKRGPMTGRPFSAPGQSMLSAVLIWMRSV
jgi:hypothetical protein